MLAKLLLVAVFLALAPTALASNTWYVDGVNGNDNNDCKSPQTACKTIGHAISLASHSDSIMVAAATYKENLSIGFSLKVIGSGASTTIIDGGGINSVFYISKRSAHVLLSKLTIQNGYTSGSGGGGICNLGTLTLTNTTISGNSADLGGGIYNGGTLTVNKSTISGNSAGWGGGIYDYGTQTVNNSTLSGNSASYSGGGINANSGTLLSVNNSTLSGNSAADGGGIYGVATLQNSIVANSPSGGNCEGAMTSNGHNLSSDSTCYFNGPGDMNNTDPKLGTLGNHGGPTQTMPLLKGSPALDAGNRTAAPMATVIC